MEAPVLGVSKAVLGIVGMAVRVGGCPGDWRCPRVPTDWGPLMSRASVPLDCGSLHLQCHPSLQWPPSFLPCPRQTLAPWPPIGLSALSLPHALARALLVCLVP